MADNLNHSDIDASCETVSKLFHLDADEDSKYFTKEKYMNNYSVVFDE